MRFENLLVIERSFFRVCKFAFDAEDLVGLDRRFRDEGFVDHAVVAIGVVRRNVAFVAEEDLHFVKRKLGAKWLGDKKGMKRFGSGTAGHRNAENAAFADGLLRSADV